MAPAAAKPPPAPDRKNDPAPLANAVPSKLIEPPPTARLEPASGKPDPKPSLQRLARVAEEAARANNWDLFAKTLNEGWAMGWSAELQSAQDAALQGVDPRFGNDANLSDNDVL